MKCINNCAEKYLAHVTRVGARFTEENMKSQAGLQ